MRIPTAGLLAILAIACSKKDEPSAAKSVAPVSSSSVSGASVPGASFVPGAILSQLGASDTVFALDFTKLDLTLRLEKLIPDHFACVREVIGSAGIAVVGVADASVVGFVTKLPARATKQCMATLGFNSVASAGGVDQFVIGDRRVSLAWRDDMAIVKEVGKEVTGTLSRATLDRIASFPPNAFAWLVLDGIDKDGVKRGALWFDASDMAIGFHGTMEGTEPGAAKKAVAGMMEGIKEGLAAKGLPVEDRWFSESSAEMTSSFVVTIPASVLQNL